MQIFYSLQRQTEKFKEPSQNHTVNTTSLYIIPGVKYLIRMLDLIGSPCSISDFFCAKIFLMVFASCKTTASHKLVSWTPAIACIVLSDAP